MEVRDRCSLAVPSCRSASAVELWAVDDSSPKPEEELNPGEAYKFSPVVPQVVALVERNRGWRWSWNLRSRTMERTRSYRL
jgi:hypothetical protein